MQFPSRLACWIATLSICFALSVASSNGQSGAPEGRRPVRAAGQSPRATALPDFYFAGSHAIWGATGQDSRGHIWFGVTGIASAHLYELDPESGQVVDRGDVVDQLDQAGIRRPGEQQAKIHSRIVQGPDNDLYFASMDEQGENADGSRLPTWGGHLWRLSLGSNRWEHLLATPEALIAVAGGGRFIYALGYFGHVLYRYDTRTGDTRRVEVGSVDGHISRNLLADARGHVYVPRLRAEPGLDGNRVVRVMLVEFGINLEEIRETPLQTDRYLGGSRPTEAHGIVGLQAMADGSIFFTTHVGFLYRVVPPAVTPARPISQVAAEVVAVGWFHPDGPSYPASLFTPDGTTALYGVARRGGDPTGAPDQWLRCDPDGSRCAVSAFVVDGVDMGSVPSSLYGSSTRDARGGHYVVGRWRRADEFKPVVLRVQP